MPAGVFILGVVAVLLILAGALVYGIWVFRTARKKRWKLACFQMTVPLVVLLGSWMAFAKIDSRSHAHYLAALFDTDVTLAAALFEYETPREFNGDGYWLSVHALPESIRRRFESADERLLKEFPKRSSQRSHWKSQTWTEGPFNAKLAEHLDFALTNYDRANGTGLSNQFEMIRKALSQKRTYYAFFAADNGVRVGNIDFFVVDLDGGRIYFINHNT